VHAAAADHLLTIEVPAGRTDLRFRLFSTDDPVSSGIGVVAAGMRVEFAAGIASVSLTNVRDELYEVHARPTESGGRISTTVRFTESVR
jgi:hypothetical protein